MNRHSTLLPNCPNYYCRSELAVPYPSTQNRLEGPRLIALDGHHVLRIANIDAGAISSKQEEQTRQYAGEYSAAARHPPFS
jgi:hypothetical protein